jgi:hypothetical protein
VCYIGVKGEWDQNAVLDAGVRSRACHCESFAIGERYYITLETLGETCGVVFVLCPHK